MLMMKSRYVLASMLCLVAIYSFAKDNKPIISVLDFDASGISSSEARVIVDFITSHIVETDKYIVIDRMQREANLEEIEFSYQDCSDEECQIEIGRLLSANQIVIGSLGKVGNRYILNIRLILVETGETLRSVSEKYSNIDSLVDESEKLVSQLLEIEMLPRILDEDNKEVGEEEKTSIDNGDLAVTEQQHEDISERREEEQKAEDSDDLIVTEQQRKAIVQASLSPILINPREKKREYYRFRGKEYYPRFLRGYSLFLDEIEKEAISDDLTVQINKYRRSSKTSRTIAVISGLALAIRVPWQYVRFETAPSSDADVNRWLIEVGVEFITFLTSLGFSMRTPTEIVNAFNEEMF
jgi:hypothetical protein